jgi:MFS family permease
MVWALAGTETVAYGVLFYSFAVFLVPMQRDLGAGTAQLSGALTLAMAVTGAAAPAVGRWLDRHGARWLMTAGSLLGAACVVGWSQVRTLPQLYLVFTGIGLACAAVLYEPAYAVINTWFHRERRAALLTLTVVAGFASTVFLPTSQALIDGLGWRSALLVLAVPVALCAVPHALLLRRSPADLGLDPDGDVAPTAGSSAPAAPPAPPTAGVDPWRHPAVRRLTLATALEMLAITAVAVHLVAHLLERGAPPPLAAAAAGALGAMSVAGRVALTALAGRLGTGPVSASLLAGQAVGVGLLFALPQPVSTVLFVLLFGAGFGVIHIARPALLGSYVPAAVFASVSGGQALAGQLGRVVAPVAAGALIGAAGYGVAFGAVAACTLAAAALILSAERAAALTPERAAPR